MIFHPLLINTWMTLRVAPMFQTVIENNNRDNITPSHEEIKDSLTLLLVRHTHKALDDHLSCVLYVNSTQG